MKANTSHAVTLRLKAIREQIGCTPVQKELLEYMKQTPVFYHKVMLFFREYQTENPPPAK